MQGEINANENAHRVPSAIIPTRSNTVKTSINIAIAAIFLASLTSVAQAADTHANRYGDAVAGDAADRTIALGATTKWVNVTDGETVRFSKDGRAFSWHFSTLSNTSFDLAAIAPANIEVKGVRVYVAPDPILSGP